MGETDTYVSVHVIFDMLGVAEREIIAATVGEAFIDRCWRAAGLVSGVEISKVCPGLAGVERLRSVISFALR